MTYKLNDTGIQALNKRIKENNKLFVIFPLFAIIYIILTYFSMRGSMFFWATSPLLLILYIFFGIISPIIAAYRFNKIITKLNIENKDNITFQTDKVNFKKGITIQLKLSDIKYINERRISYGSGLEKGLLIRLKTDEEFYLMEKFYNEYETIKTDLKTK